MSAEPKQIEKVGPTGLRVVWEDGHQSLYRWQELRAACPCAVCLPPGGPVGGREAAPSLPMAGAAHPLEIRPVGRYAMTVQWSDGHTTGIFSYDYLRSICSCEECRPNQFLEG